jgi:RNA polymerase sigma-70 factor (ECF subfamily)
VQNWQLIVDKHGPMVWKIVYRLLANYQDAQDCFQETFVAALELSRKEAVLNFRALLVKIANARAIDRLRRRYRCDQNDTVDIDTLTSGEPAPDEQMHSIELAEQLRQALAQVHQQEAEVFCLRFLNDLSYRQIAKMTGLKKNAVGVMLHRTKQQLREILERQEKISEKKARYSNES